MRSDIIITKASGKKEPFAKSKLHQSLLRAGAPAVLANEIVEAVELDLTEAMSTKSIYKIAYKLLSNAERNVAGRYHLKHAIMELGPSGYAFEKYIGEILRQQGYKVAVGEIVQGQCVKHEIDVIAEMDHHHFYD